MEPAPSGPSASTDNLLAFASIRILSLPNRLDRRKALQKELGRLDIEIKEPRVSFLRAVRPPTPNGFDCIGTRGCFLSHLAALREARDTNVSTLLILEDDVAFSFTERKAMKVTLRLLFAQHWDVFYGGSAIEQRAVSLTKLSPGQPAQLAHFIAFSDRAIRLLVPYLEALLTRAPGSPLGGPMHVDGAYSHFRHDNPGILSFAATPPIAHQRASRTDIHILCPRDQSVLLRPVMAGLRWIKNLVVSSR